MTGRRSLEKAETHLTVEQFGELVEGANTTLTRLALKHLAECLQCREELDSTRKALVLFRESTAAFAQKELSRAPRVQAIRIFPAQRRFSAGLAWAAAGLLVLAAALPVELQRHTRQPAGVSHVAAPAGRAGESDEALLDDINREVSASVPAPMQALEDPIGSASGANSVAQISTTRKN